MEKKKILFITTQFNQGGVEKTLIEAVKILSPDKYDITLLIRLNKTDLVYLLPKTVRVIVNKDDRYFREFIPLVIIFLNKISHLLQIKSTDKYFNEKLAQYINRRKAENPKKKYFKHEKFDVVISYTVGLCTEMGLHIPARKHFVFYHSERTDMYTDTMEHCFPKYDSIIACGHGVEAMLHEKMPQYNDKLTTLCNYIDHERIHNQASLFNPYSNIEKGIYILCTCGRVSRQKGYDLAVHAAQILKKNGISYKWYIVGDGDKWDEIASMVEDNQLENDFIMVGNQENPFPYYQYCDVYVQTSYDEAQPLSIMEALALGKAIVSTNTLGGRVVLNNGEKGMLVPITAEGIADGIQDMLLTDGKKKLYEHKYDDNAGIADRERYKKEWENLLA